MQTSKEIHLLVKNKEAADLVVCGLTVLDRNCRTLNELGYDVSVKTEGALIPGVPVFRGDFQYPLQFFADGLEGKNSQNGHDVSALLSRESKQNTQKFLEKTLFQNIHDKTEGWIARSLNKKVSFFLTKYLVKTPITPNQISFFCFLIGLIGCVGLLSPRWGVRVGGAFLIQFSSILDGCDGEVARLKLLSSNLGAWLDTIFDDIINFLMLACLIAGYYFQFPNQNLLLVSATSSVAYIGMSFVLYHYLITHGTANAAHFKLSWQKDEEGNEGATLFDKVKPILKRDFVLFLAFIFILIDQRAFLAVFLVPVWVGFFLYMASFIHSLIKKGRQSERELYQS